MRLCALLLAGGLALAGCGYHPASSGYSSKLPASIHDIYVPNFTNKTTSYGIDRSLTAAVIRELEGRTRYHVVLADDGSEQAKLLGTVESAQSSPLTYDSQTGRASSALVLVRASVKLVGKDGQVLYNNPNYTFREQYQVSRELSSFFEEESPAMDRLSRDFGRQLVADIMEAF
jgi:outer membrane lipopolysaccharide assembly protein LptE/RlpB